MKITVVGAGNGGCLTALHLGWYTRQQNYIEVELIYNPDIHPEPVGQATLLELPSLLWGSLGFNWYDNPIHATFKSGILYENWGRKKDKHFHEFPSHYMAMHFCPWELQDYILKSGYFKVTESSVLDINKIDADYIIDCRGKPKDFSNYDTLDNPLNSCILSKPNWDTAKNPWSRHVATPDGWTFVIPTDESSPSHKNCVGYCYNSDITSKEDAEKNMLDMFDVSVTKHIQFNNYIAKEPIIDNRIFLNGNRLFFLDPLESNSSAVYIQWARTIMDTIIYNEMTQKEASTVIKTMIHRIKNFIIWHYQSGSKYDTSFWNYAKTLKFKDQIFDQFYQHALKHDAPHCRPTDVGGMTEDKIGGYAIWGAYSFRNWVEGMGLINN